MVYGAYGEQVQSRGRGSDEPEPPPAAAEFQSQQDLLIMAKKELVDRGINDWKSISMQTSVVPGSASQFPRRSKHWGPTVKSIQPEAGRYPRERDGLANVCR